MMKPFIMWALAGSVLYSGAIYAAVKVNDPSPSPLEAATLQVLQLGDKLKEAQLANASCQGMLKLTVDSTIGAESKGKVEKWLHEYELAHPGYSYDVLNNKVVSKNK